jgi:hypothetical protein
MADAYLAELEKAHLLPHWAVGRDSTDRTSYTSDRGGILEQAIVPRRRRRPDPRTVVIAILVAALSILATSPERSALSSLVSSRVGARDPDIPLLNPPPDDSPLVFDDPWPRLPGRASPPARAKRDVARQVAPAPFVPRRGPTRNPYDSPAAPDTPTDRSPLPAPVSPSVQFGI